MVTLLFLVLGFAGCFIFVLLFETNKQLSAVGLIFAFGGWSFFIVEIIREWSMAILDAIK